MYPHRFFATVRGLQFKKFKEVIEFYKLLCIRAQTEISSIFVYGYEMSAAAVLRGIRQGMVALMPPNRTVSKGKIKYYPGTNL